MLIFHFTCYSAQACTVDFFDAVLRVTFFLQAIPSHSVRRSLFEQYVKTRAEEERREKRAAHKAAVEGFRQLLDEASKVYYFIELSFFFTLTFELRKHLYYFVLMFSTCMSLVGVNYHPDIFQDIDQHTDYHAFKRKWGNDLRFEALERKEREALLKERYHHLYFAVRFLCMRQNLLTVLKFTLNDSSFFMWISECLILILCLGSYTFLVFVVESFLLNGLQNKRRKKSAKLRPLISRQCYVKEKCQYIHIGPR